MPSTNVFGYCAGDGTWKRMVVNASGELIIDPTKVTLDKLGDVEVPAPTDGYVLYWNATDGRWECKAVAAPSVGCRAYTAQVMTLHTNTWTAIALEKEAFDTDNIHDNVTNNSRLTCKTAGMYLIEGALLFDANGFEHRMAGLDVSGVTRIARGEAARADIAYPTVVLVALWNLAVNDYVELVGFQDSGGDRDTLDGGQLLHLSMVKVG